MVAGAIEYQVSIVLYGELITGIPLCRAVPVRGPTNVVDDQIPVTLNSDIGVHDAHSVAGPERDAAPSVIDLIEDKVSIRLHDQFISMIT